MILRLIVYCGLLLAGQALALALANHANTKLRVTDKLGRSWMSGGVKTHHLLELNKSPSNGRCPSSYFYRVGLKRVRIYLVDGGINVDHDEFRDLRRRGAIRALKQTEGNGFNATGPHGTCMASLLAGDEWGAYPDVGSLTIAHRGYEGQLRYGRFFEEIEHDLDQSGSTDPVVVSASWGVCDAFKLPGGPDPPRRRSQPQADLYTRMKSLGDKYRVVYAVAIGNAGTYDELQALCLPHRWATTDDDRIPVSEDLPPFTALAQKPDTRELPGIVLVGAMESNPRNATYEDMGELYKTTYGDRHNYSAVMNPMLYAPSGIACASHENNSATQLELGTSLSTPLTAGLIANLWDTEENINKNATEIIELVRGMAWSRGTKPDIRTIWNGFEARKRPSIVDWWRALTGHV